MNSGIDADLSVYEKKFDLFVNVLYLYSVVALDAYCIKSSLQIDSLNFHIVLSPLIVLTFYPLKQRESRVSRATISVIVLSLTQCNLLKAPKPKGPGVPRDYDGGGQVKSMH